MTDNLLQVKYTANRIWTTKQQYMGITQHDVLRCLHMTSAQNIDKIQRKKQPEQES